MEVFNAINVVPIPEIPQNQLEDFFQAKAATLLGILFLGWWIGQFGVPCLGPRCLGVMCDLVGKRCNEFLVTAGLSRFDLP